MEKNKLDKELIAKMKAKKLEAQKQQTIIKKKSDEIKIADRIKRS
jgi:hypothetical protein